MRVAGALQSFYTVPVYQREYVWDSENVNQLLNDIRDNTEASATGAPIADSDVYFIGSIVVVVENNAPQKFVLIDGQQRLTTLFLILCGIKARLTELGEDTPNWLNDTLRNVVVDAKGDDKHEYRLELNYKKNQEILIEAFRGDVTVKASESRTPSQKNMVQAFTCVRDFLKEYESSVALKQFAADLQNKVGLVRIETSDMQKALVVFETLNDRGVGLDAFDLLKNLLYKEVSNDQTSNQLTEIWNEIKDYIADSAHIRPLRFLRYFLFSIDDDIGNKPPTEQKAFSWFQNNENLDRFSINHQPIKFAKRLHSAAKHYNEMLTRSLNHLGERSPAMSSLNCLAGKTARQHMALLLTAAEKNCPKEKFERLVESIESVLFYSFSTGLRSQTLEQHFSDWTRRLKKMNLTDDSAFDDLIQVMRNDMMGAYTLFYEGFDSFSQLSVNRARLIYILGKFLQNSEKLNNDSDYAFLDTLIGKSTSKLEIEHVYPQNPSTASRDEFGVTDDDESEESIRLLSNLLLMEASLQKSCSNKPYSEKKLKYSESQFWMVKKFAKENPFGPSSLIKGLKAWPTHEGWNREELLRRQEFLKEKAREIWNFGRG